MTLISKQEVFQGGSLLLECETTGRPRPTISWQKDGKLVQAGPRIYISPDRSRLQIFSVQQENQGVYTCIADNIVGQDKGRGMESILN